LIKDFLNLIGRLAGAEGFHLVFEFHHRAPKTTYTDLLNFLDASVSFYLGHGSIAGTSYGSGEAGAQATAQSERTKPVLVANRFHAISQASMMSARLRNTELASQWLRR